MVSEPSGPELRRQRIRLAVTGCVTIAAIAGVALLLDGSNGAVDGSSDALDGDITVHADGSSWRGAAPTGPIITEIVSSNASTLADEDGDQPDWIELHNPTDEALSLEGYHLSDDPEDPSRWALPELDLDPGGHLIVFASGKDRTDPDGELHTDFALAQGDEPVLLVEPDGATIADRITVIDIPRNASFGRDPDQLARTCFFTFPSPGEANAPECYDDTDLGAPTLSHATGFYDEPFELEITAPDPDATIYYTLDGSFPDPDTNPDNTFMHDNPIRIVDRTPEPNTISMIPTTVPEHREFIAPDHEVPKGTAIRARTEHSATSVANYFVGDVPPHGDLSVVAVTIDPDLLFGPDDGIHVGGRLYDEWASSDQYDSDALRTDVEANYVWRGREWERPLRDELHNEVAFEFCESSSDCSYLQEVGIRIHGGFSRFFPNKSLRLYARNDYGSNSFDYDFWGHGISEHSRLILRTSGSDFQRLRFADAFFQSLAAGFVSDTQATRPAVMYINGEYWGIHNIRERYDPRYLQAVHGVDRDRIQLLDNSTTPRNQHRRADPPVGDFYRASPFSPETYERWLDYVKEVAASDPESEAFVVLVESELDIENFYDFIIAHSFPAVSDWVHNNSRWWRSDPSTAAGVGVDDGRWRFLISDFDSWGSDDGSHDSFTERMAPNQPVTARDGLPALFNTMMANAELRDRFVSRFADHLNSAFAQERTLDELSRWSGTYSPDMEDTRARWVSGSLDSWYQEVDDLASFLQARPATQRQQLRERFDLGEDRQVVVHFEPHSTDVHLNTLRLGDWITVDPQESVASWSGTYFQGDTLRLQVEPNNDAAFSHWLIDGEVRLAERTVEIPVEADLDVEVVLTGSR